MKYTTILLAGFAVSTIAHASEELAASNNCLACHKVDSQLVGPSFQDVAAKYKDQDGAAEMLSETVKNGSSGTWGAIPMPPNAGASDDDIKALVDWILAM